MVDTLIDLCSLGFVFSGDIVGSDGSVMTVPISDQLSCGEIWLFCSDPLVLESSKFVDEPAAQTPQHLDVLKAALRSQEAPQDFSARVCAFASYSRRHSTKSSPYFRRSSRETREHFHTDWK